MRKKVKSFALEDGPYEKLFELFKENYVEISLSYCINKYIKEFLEYLNTIQNELKKDKSYTVPMTYIIETIAREPIFKKFDTESSIKEEAKDLQKRYEAYIKKYPEKKQEFDIESIEKEESFVKVLKAITKAMKEVVRQGRDLTDDEYREIVRKEGKGFVKYVRENITPKIKRNKKQKKEV